MGSVEEVLDGGFQFRGAEFVVHAADAAGHFGDDADEESAGGLRVGFEEGVEVFAGGFPDLAEALGGDVGAGLAGVEDGDLADRFAGFDAADEGALAVLFGVDVEDAGDEEVEAVLVGAFGDEIVAVLEGEELAVVAEEAAVVGIEVGDDAEGGEFGCIEVGIAHGGGLVSAKCQPERGAEGSRNVVGGSGDGLEGEMEEEEGDCAEGHEVVFVAAEEAKNGVAGHGGEGVLSCQTGGGGGYAIFLGGDAGERACGGVGGEVVG